MAIAYDNATAGSSLTGASSLTFSHTTGSLVDGVIVVMVGYYRRTRMVSTLTYGGVALTKRLRFENGVAQATTEIWWGIAPLSGANDVVVTMDAALATDEILAGALTYSGVDQIVPIEADGGGSVTTGTHTTQTDSVVTLTPLAWLVDCCLVFNLDPSTTVTGQTEKCAVTSIGLSHLDCSDQGPIVTPASTTMAWSFGSTGTATGQMVIVLRASRKGAAYYLRRLKGMAA